MKLIMEIFITEAVSEDVEGIQKVFYETWLDTYPNEEYKITLDDLKYRHKDIFNEETFEKRRRMIRDRSNNELFLVAKFDEKIVGVCYLEKDETKNSIHAMYVLPKYQGKGIGSGFWKNALDFFDKSKEIIVNVVVYNANAIAFYKKMGFVDTGKRFTEERFRMKSGSIMPEMEMKISR
jgi:ribosomal protein S18 acetylase RimI-like enzyme